MSLAGLDGRIATATAREITAAGGVATAMRFDLAEPDVLAIGLAVWSGR